MKILHVTEVFASGVLSLLASISARQVHRGNEVVILYAATPETPDTVELSSIFDPRVTLVEVAGRDVPRLRSTWLLRRALRLELKDGGPDVVHLHSTYAGVIGRIGIGYRRFAQRTFYSPHGFAFLQRNHGRAFRGFARLVERMGSRRGSLVLSAESERQLAVRALGDRIRGWVVVNGIDIAALPAGSRVPAPRPTVVMIGRVAYQKAPWIFATAASALGDSADFVWLGDGPETDKERWLGDSGVTVSGWMPLPALRKALIQADLVLFCSLWEGMPLSLIEAQAMGVPAVATNVPGNRDIVVDGETGYLANSDSELVERTRELLADPLRRTAMSARAAELTRTRFDNERLDRELFLTYESVLRGEKPPRLGPAEVLPPSYVPDPIRTAHYD